jgi:hypothetical protein
VVISRGEIIENKIKNTGSIYSNSLFFSVKILAKQMQVLATLNVEHNKVKIKMHSVLT